MARTRTASLRIDSAGGEAGSKIDRFCTDARALANREGITTVTPVLADKRRAGRLRMRPTYRRRSRSRASYWLRPRLMTAAPFAGRRFAENQSRLAVQADLDDVWAKQKRKGPRGHDAQPPAPTRHLQQVIRAPHEPGEDAAHPYLEKLAKGFAVTQRAHHPQVVVHERPRRLAVENRNDVTGQHLGLAQGMLR